MTTPRELPPEFSAVRQRALRALSPVRAADDNTNAASDFLFKAKPTEAGRELPPYFLVYFLLVGLLGFRNLGRFEKVAWSVPLDFNGQAFLVEHRKFGLGLFAHDPEAERHAALEIASRIARAVKAAGPYFDWLAADAVANSQVNLLNNSSILYQRYLFLRRMYDAKAEESERRKGEQIVELGEHEHGTWQSVTFPALTLRAEANWLAFSVIEAFFSWSEQVLIHVGVLIGRITSAKQAADVALSTWPDKFKIVFDIQDRRVADSFEQMMAVRSELRNYVAHGAFGKQGEAFQFHSRAGAVPVLLPHKRGGKRFVLGSGLQFDAPKALEVIDAFVAMLWSGPRAPARLLIQEAALPTVMPFATDGTYAAAMQSEEAMQEWIDRWIDQIDTAANMDW